MSSTHDPNRLPRDRPMCAIFFSDIGHRDVAHMDEVLTEASENLEHGWMNATQLRDSMRNHAIRMSRGAKPRFFAGTVVDDDAASKVDPGLA